MSSTSAVLAPGLEPKRIPFDRIPLVDFAAVSRRGDSVDFGTAAERRVAEAVGRACRDIGFFYLENHGISDAIIDQAFQQARWLFALPEAQKDGIHVRHSRIHRGYFPAFEENTDPEQTADFKEGFDMSAELPADDPDALSGNRLYGPNAWPAHGAEFKRAMLAYYDALDGLARRIMGAFAIALDLPQDFFADKLEKCTSLLRVLHYPSQGGQVDAEVLGTGAHSDYGCLTILAQDDIGGLQIRNCAGEWVSAPPIPGTFVVNVGDLMARWTNDVFTATRHRVINTTGRERYSIPFFFHPSYHTRVTCLETCRDAEHPPRYPPVIAGEHILGRLDSTYEHRQPT